MGRWIHRRPARMVNVFGVIRRMSGGLIGNDNSYLSGIGWFSCMDALPRKNAAR